ncbi:MAG: DMT family transporter [Gammaproteobacteria bacterium]|nr:DMT family transporter [Gammaproteobacteria bacterium]
MEPWFLFAVASAFLSGFHAYIYKIVAARNIDVIVVSVYASFASALVLLTITALFFGFHGISLFIVGLALLEGLIYFTNNIFRNIALKAIDTVIYFPIYKIFGPLLGICFGVVFFSEKFTPIEWTGLVISLFVPLMLIGRQEHLRQTNLVKGLYLVLITALLAAINATISKVGSTATSNAIVFILLADTFIITSGFLALYAKEKRRLFTRMNRSTNSFIIQLSVALGVIQAGAFGFFVFAFATNGPLAIVYTIHSLYIVIPIVLSVMFYNEHLNLRKIIAVVLSIAAIGLLK